MKTMKLNQETLDRIMKKGDEALYPIQRTPFLREIDEAHREFVEFALQYVWWVEKPEFTSKETPSVVTPENTRIVLNRFCSTPEMYKTDEHYVTMCETNTTDWELRYAVLNNAVNRKRPTAVQAIYEARIGEFSYTDPSEWNNHWLGREVERIFQGNGKYDTSQGAIFGKHPTQLRSRTE